MALKSYCLLSLIIVALGSVFWPAEGSILGNKTLQNRISPSLEMTTLITTTSHVLHMEPDLHIAGNILFSDTHALRTTSGITTTTIAGSRSSSGNIVSIGLLARFGSIGGFYQISETHVILGDHRNHCLRLVNRLTLETPWYAGYCGSSGYSQGTTSARFNLPWGVYQDNKRAGMLLVTDHLNDAIRHVQTAAVDGGVHSVSEFFKSSTLHRPQRLAQDPISGDLYITTQADKIFRLTYTSKTLSLLAGSSSGFVDGNFASSKFDDPEDIILIENGRKLLLVDNDQHRLRILDLITRSASSFCTGQQGHTDGDLSSCTLDSPWSLMALNNNLYIGEYQRIRKVSGYGGVGNDYCSSRNYEVSTATGLALVEIPGPEVQVKLSLPPGRHAIHVQFPNVDCTVEYLVSDQRQNVCPQPEIRKIASVDTGVAVVDIPLSGSQSVKLSLPPGNHPLHIASDTSNCTIEYLISDYRLRRRLVFEAQYKVRCETTTGNIAKDPMSLAVAQHAFGYSEICASDCIRPLDAEVELTCLNETLTVVWPSNITYTGEINRIPAELDQRLTARIVAKGSGYYLFLPEINPPIVFPEQEENGGYMRAQLDSYCVGESIMYIKTTDSCQEQVGDSRAEM